MTTAYLFSSPALRWKSGSRISAPSIKRSWSTAADQREITSTAPAPSLLARPPCPSCGRFPWRAKEPQCTQTITWTVLGPGIRTTTLTRTPCRGLRWCEWIVFGVAPFEAHFMPRWTGFSQRPPLGAELCLKSCLIDFVQCISCEFWFQYFLRVCFVTAAPNPLMCAA